MVLFDNSSESHNCVLSLGGFNLKIKLRIICCGEFKLNIVHANGFYACLDGSAVCPSSQIRNDEGNLVPNSAYALWTLIDTQLLSCLTTSLSPTTLPYILGLHHTHAVWDSLSHRYNTLSKSNVQDLKNKLYNLTKTSTIERYVDTIKEYAQKLAAAGSSIDDDDLIFHTIRDLPPVFNGLKTTVRALQTSGQNIIFNDVVNILKVKIFSFFKIHIQQGWTLVLCLLLILINQDMLLVLLLLGVNLGTLTVGLQITLPTIFRIYLILNLPILKKASWWVVVHNFRFFTLAKDCFQHLQDKTSHRTLYKGLCHKSQYPLLTFYESFSTRPPTAFVSISSPSAMLWHQKLGHPSLLLFQALIKQHSLPVSKPQLVNCRCCNMAKSQKLQFSVSVSATSSPFQLIHMDVWGPSPIPSHKGFRYYLLLVDDFTRFTWLFPFHYKSEVKKVIAQFQAYVSTQFHTTVQTFRSDNGGEFINHFPLVLFLTKGIIHQTSCPHTSEQNGLAERKHRHLIETTITLLLQSHLPTSFWLEALTTTVYLINRMPHTSLKFQVPYTMLFHSSPDYLFLKPFR
ncbi:uncharacterized protein LOC131321235 [Rhododendron vialii]|uniref:uncharacterized protein LOC131321235 n=1 Tax=Rhododendron vialii TaxID=182163 RepID=UPI00265EAEF0|nr:uncharacterized protein LOC131321235 [Rhododendron vialii]